MTFITTMVTFTILSRDMEEIGEITLRGDVEVRWADGERYYMILREMEQALEEKLGRRVEIIFSV